MKYLITGGAGYIGNLLAESLKKDAHKIVIFDKIYDRDLAKKYVYFQGDIRNQKDLEKVFRNFGPFDCVFHAAALVAYLLESKRSLWETNVFGTKNVIQLAVKFKVPHFIFFSSSCVYGNPSFCPISENDPKRPLEIYGKSKLLAEKILENYKNKINITIFRCPTVVSKGRLGILSILYEFIREGRNIYIPGRGKNKHHFLSSQDLIRASRMSAKKKGFFIFNIGSLYPLSLKEIFEVLINLVESKSKVVSLPIIVSKITMKLVYLFRISPLGPYHYKMISEDLILDTTKIEKELSFRPKIDSYQILKESYSWFLENYLKIHSQKTKSPHRSLAKMGIIKILKFIS